MLLAIALFFLGMGAPLWAAPSQTPIPTKQFHPLPGTYEDAEYKSQSLFISLQGWAGWVLIVGIVVAAIAAIIGNYRFAIGITIGCLILYGGAYFLSMIRYAVAMG
jgi:hypothetical protein